MTGEWLNDRVREIRSRTTTGDEASLWALFFEDADGEPVMALAVQGAAREFDAGSLPNFARVLEEVDASAYLLAIIRSDARPSPADLQLWRGLQLLWQDNGCRMLGFLVVGTTAHWCAPGGDAPAAA